MHLNYLLIVLICSSLKENGISEHIENLWMWRSKAVFCYLILYFFWYDFVDGKFIFPLVKKVLLNF